MAKQGDKLLEINELAVRAGEQQVLESVSIDVAAGEVVAIMGANGSGKSTLGFALAGHPRYEVTGGTARLAGADLLAMAPEERARAGLFLSFQSPPDLPGVRNNLFMRTSLNSVLEARDEEPVDAFDFLERAKAIAADIDLPAAFLNRPVNEGFSGGERKRNELLQLAMLAPKVAILDEVDSGMDVDGLRSIVETIERMRAKGTAFLLISHSLAMAEAVKPDRVAELDGGRIARIGSLDVARDIARIGFARTRESVEG